jgi:hypothetical protein
MLVSIYRQIADCWELRCAAILLEVIAGIGMYHLSTPLEAIPGGANIPDLRPRGYTPDELYAYYEEIGEEGRELYFQAETWDCFPYMLGYTFLLGFLLIDCARDMGRSENISLLMTAVYVMDVIETITQRYGCGIYPERLSDTTATIAGLACRLKWMGLFVVAAIVVEAKVRVHLLHHKPPKTAKNNDEFAG